MTPNTGTPFAGPTSPASENRPKRGKRWLWITAALVVFALLGTLIGGEVYARTSADDCLTGQFKQALGSDVKIGLSSRPMLWQLLTKDVPYVTVASQDSRFGTAVGMAIRAKASNISIERDSKRAGSIGSTLAEVKWPTSGILQTLKNSPTGVLVKDVKTSPSDGTLVLTMGVVGLSELVVKPQLNNGVVEVSATKASVMGIGIPPSVVDGIVKLFTSTLQYYPLGMQARSLKVTDAGVEVELAGGHYDMPLPHSAPSSNSSSNPGSDAPANAAPAKPRACEVP